MDYEKYLLKIHVIFLCVFICEGNINTTNETVPFIKTSDGFVEVFTDGACSRNGQVGAKAGIGIWFNANHPLNLSGPVKGNATNNNAEIEAAVIAIKQAISVGIKKLRIKTDSKLVINAMTKWIYKWKVNNWTLSRGKKVKNKAAWILLDEAIKHMEDVQFEYVKRDGKYCGHWKADELAKKGAQTYKELI